MKRTKILHIGKTLSGIETYVRLTMGYLDSNKFTFAVICGINESKNGFYYSNGKIIRCKEVDMEREFSLFKDIIVIFKSFFFVLKERPDVIHCHGSKGGLVGRIVGFFTFKPVIYTPHAFSYLSINNKLKRRFFLNYEKIFKYITNIVLCCSESERRRAVEEVGFRNDKVKVWENSIEKIDVGDNISGNYLIAIGRPSYQKNTTFLIEVVNLLRKKYDCKISLKILGVGYYSPEKIKVEKMIEHYGLSDSIEMINWCERIEALKILQKAYCYISTSRYEGLSYANLESLAMGIPIIASAVDGNVDTTINGKTGFLIEENNLEFFTQKTHELIVEREKRDRFSKNSIKLFEEKFDINKTIVKLEQIYTTLIN